MIGVESGLSMALADDEGLGIVMLRQGVSRERAAQALLAGLPEGEHEPLASLVGLPAGL